jgi:hypothetical protein
MKINGCQADSAPNPTPSTSQPLVSQNERLPTIQNLKQIDSSETSSICCLEECCRPIWDCILEKLSWLYECIFACFSSPNDEETSKPPEKSVDLVTKESQIPCPKKYLERLSELKDNPPPDFNFEKDIKGIDSLANIDTKNSNFNGFTLLHFYCSLGQRLNRPELDPYNLPIVHYIIFEKEADVNATDNEGNTPLHLAPTMEIALLLLKSGAKIDTENTMGKTGIQAFFERIKTEIDIKKIEGYTLLMWSAQEDWKEVAAFLLKNGASADLKSEDENQWTALEIAVKNGHNEDEWLKIFFSQ